MTPHVYIGYDPREHNAAKVCASSITRRGDAHVHMLDDRKLRRLGDYDRPYRVSGSGQYIDERDDRPFSTLFAFTRFLTPHCAANTGMTDRWVLFCDCDFIFLRPVRELFALADPKYAVMVVKHKHNVEEPHTKMDGVSQLGYRCKNWSSLVLWNLDHPQAYAKRSDINERPGAWLHSFGWIEDRGLIGALPEEWNWLAGVSPTTRQRHIVEHPKAIHYTEGGPWMEGYEDGPFSRCWLEEAAEGALSNMG